MSQLQKKKKQEKTKKNAENLKRAISIMEFCIGYAFTLNIWALSLSLEHCLELKANFQSKSHNNS